MVGEKTGLLFLFLPDFDCFMHMIRQKVRKGEREIFLEITVREKISCVLDWLSLPGNSLPLLSGSP